MSFREVSKVRPTFFIRVNTQFDNVGDALINRELIKLASSVGHVTIDTHTVPDHFAKWMASKEVDATSLKSGIRFWISLFLLALSGAKGSCYMFLNPGGNRGEISRLSFVKKSAKVVVLRALRSLGCEIILLGASYEDLGNRNRQVVRWLSHVIRVHSVRDRLTLEYCRANGIKVDAIVPDLAFNLPTPSASVPKEYIVVSLRETFHLEDLAALSSLLDADLPIKLCWQVTRDEQHQRRIAEALRHAGRPVDLVPLLEGIAENLEFYSRASKVISNRLHVLLMGMSVGAIPVPLLTPKKNNKIRGVFADLGLEALIREAPVAGETVDLSRDTLAVLKEKFASASLELKQGFNTVVLAAPQ